MSDIPEHILRRSAEARAKAEGRPVEEVLEEMRRERAASVQPLPITEEERAVSEDEEAAVEAAAAAEPPVTGAPPEEPESVEPSPDLAPIPEAAPPAAEPVPAAVAPGPAAAPDASRDISAESEEYGVPEHLLERAMEARAKAEGKPIPPAPGEPTAPAAPTATPSAPPAAAAAAPAPAAPPAIPEGVRTQRLLTVVKAGAIQQVKKEPTDKVSVWPHLVASEFVALLVVLAFLTIWSILYDAPLLEFANFNDQPNPSKAPWYFLGLQELLAYLDPQVAGVIIPTFGLVGLAIVPYIDRNPSVRPSDRKLAIMIFAFFLIASAILTIFGSFLRGPGFNFVFPWEAGIFFDF